MITRSQYMAKEFSHEAYYGQFVSGPLRVAIGNSIGWALIKASTDDSFNDIPLSRWGLLERMITGYCARAVKATNFDGGKGPNVVTKTDWMCIAKEAARQIRGW